MPSLFPAPDKKLFSELIELAGDYHTFERAYVESKRGGSEPPSLEQLVQAILKLKSGGAAEPEESGAISEQEVGT